MSRNRCRLLFGLWMLTAALGCSTASDDASQEVKLEPLPATEARDKALAAVNENKFDVALELAQRGLISEPDHRDLLFLAGGLLVQRGFDQEQSGNQEGADRSYQEASQYLNRLADGYDDLDERERAFIAMSAFHEATSAARKEDTEQAIAKLRRAVEFGFNEFAQIEENEAWAAVRESEAFQAALSELKTDMSRALDQETTQELSSFDSFAFDFALPGIDGQTYTKEQFAGKVLIVDIWGTWCPPCRREIPHFVKLYEEYGSEGLAIVGVNYEQGSRDQAIDEIRKFEKQTVSIPYPLVLGDDETRSQIPDFGGFPTTLFIDRSGTVRLSLLGYHEYSKLESIVKRLLSEEQGAE